jgi:hypothetical protein
MRKIPTSINAQFNALLDKHNIPKTYQNHYLKRLRYYLDFCHVECTESETGKFFAGSRR